VFGARYRIVRPIKSGGMGAVYEVVDERTRGARALKVMLPSMVSSAQQRARFEQEAQVTGAIDSEHIVRVFDAGVDAGGPFLVMELLRGEDLQDVADRGKLGHEDVCRYLMQASRALDKTFAAGIVHRDIKPGNLFLSHRDDGSPCVKILDFGLAKLVLPDAAKKTRALGTPLYMAPEQVKGDGDIGPRADLYALAHVAYALLTGEPYWSVEGKAAASSMLFLIKVVAGAQEAASVRALHRTNTTLPAGFDAWFAKATCAAPDGRFDGALAQTRALAALWSIVPSASTPGFAPARPTPAPTSNALPSASPSRPGLETGTAPTQWALTAQRQRTAPMARLSSPTLEAGPLAPPLSPIAATTAMATLKRPPRARTLFVVVGILIALAGGAAALLLALQPTKSRPRRRAAPSAEASGVSSPAPDESSKPVQAPMKCHVDRCAPFAPPVPSNVELSLVMAEIDKLARAHDPQVKRYLLFISRVTGDSAVDLTKSMTVMYGASRGSLAVTVVLPQLQLVSSTSNLSFALPWQDDCTLQQAVKTARAQGIPPDDPLEAYYAATATGPSWRISGSRLVITMGTRCAVTQRDKR